MNASPSRSHVHVRVCQCWHLHPCSLSGQEQPVERSMIATRCGSSSSSAGCRPGALRSATSHSCSPSSSRFSSSGCASSQCNEQQGTLALVITMHSTTATVTAYRGTCSGLRRMLSAIVNNVNRSHLCQVLQTSRLQLICPCLCLSCLGYVGAVAQQGQQQRVAGSRVRAQHVHQPLQRREHLHRSACRVAACSAAQTVPLPAAFTPVSFAGPAATHPLITDHGGWERHGRECFRVLGFEPSPRGTRERVSAPGCGAAAAPPRAATPPAAAAGWPPRTAGCPPPGAQ